MKGERNKGKEGREGREREEEGKGEKKEEALPGQEMKKQRRGIKAF